MKTLSIDTFIRANQSGWGTASDGSTWATITGSPTLSIASNEGVMTGGGGNDVYIKLGSITANDQSGLVRFALTISTFPYAGIMLRFTDGNNWYRFFGNSGEIVIDKLVSGSYTSLATISKTYTSGTFYWMRSQVAGVTLQARTWQDGTTEPTGWDITATDSGLVSGGFGLFGKTSAGDQVQFDHFTATDIQPVKAHQGNGRFLRIG